MGRIGGVHVAPSVGTGSNLGMAELEVSPDQLEHGGARKARRPTISVVIPTYRRLALLERAVQSVFDQDFDDWELVVSDDENKPSETWSYLQSLEETDQRVRAVRNVEGQGQVSNTNNGLRIARGAWLKPLHDDDRLKPGALKALIDAASFCPEAVTVWCRSDAFVDGSLARRFERGRRPKLERIGPKGVLSAMLFMEDVGGARPSELMLRRELVDAGIWMEEKHGLSVMVDSWWNARLRVAGSSLSLNRALIEWHQGEHESVTSLSGEEGLDSEMLLYRKYVLELMQENGHGPVRHGSEDLAKLIRGLHALRLRQWSRVKSAFLSICGGSIVFNAPRWLMQRQIPGSISRTEREKLT